MYKEVEEKDFDYRSVVTKGYDNCAEKYYMARQKEEEPSLEFIFANVPEYGSILDVGCGSGVPVCSLLSKKYQVSGIDISSKQIELAKKNVPTGKFINVDVLEYELESNSLDAVVSYYMLFHIPKEKHGEVLSKLYGWLKPGGYLIISLAHDEENGYTEDDFFDETMYWSNYGMKEYQEIFADLGFKIIQQKELNHGYVGDEPMTENHPMVFAIKE